MFAALVVYLFILVFLFIFQRNLQYHPNGVITSLESYDLKNFEEKILTTKDDLKILSWYKKPSNKNEKIILYFHGNAGNMGDRAHIFKKISLNEFGVLAISYRGYFGSEGKPSEAGLIMDAEAALNFLFTEGYKSQDIIFFGESLGSGVATQLAEKFSPYALILESPFSSIVNVAKKSYWFVPVDLILKDKFESIKYITKVSAPILIFHGTNDNVVPYREGEKLFNAINSPKKFITIQDGGHLNFGDEFLIKEIKNFLKEKK